MQSTAITVEQYMEHLPRERKEAMATLRKEILKNIPPGFEEKIAYEMIGYVVPHSLYPAGYHCNPSLPLLLMNIASQKNFIAVYHMGIYGSKELLNWFVTEYATTSKAKLDMGKSCIRFKKIENIPFKLIGELAGKLTVKEWLNMYEHNLKKQ